MDFELLETLRSAKREKDKQNLFGLLHAFNILKSSRVGQVTLSIRVHQHRCPREPCCQILPAVQLINSQVRLVMELGIWGNENEGEARADGVCDVWRTLLRLQEPQEGEFEVRRS